MKRKVKIGVEPSMNFQKVKFEIEEVVEFKDESDFQKQVDKLQKKVRDWGYDMIRKTMDATKRLKNEQKD